MGDVGQVFLWGSLVYLQSPVPRNTAETNNNNQFFAQKYPSLLLQQVLCPRNPISLLLLWIMLLQVFSASHTYIGYKANIVGPLFAIRETPQPTWLIFDLPFVLGCPTTVCSNLSIYIFLIIIIIIERSFHKTFTQKTFLFNTKNA